MINRSNYIFYLGAIISQLFTLLTSYFVLWKLSPEIYGEFSYFISISSIYASLSTLKFEQSIAISSKIDEASNKFFLTLFVGVGLNILSSLLTFPFIDNFDLHHLLLSILLSIGIILNASLQQFFLYLGRHLYNAILTVSIPLSNLIFTYLLLYVAEGLIFAYVISYFIISVVFFAFLIYKRWLNFSNLSFLRKIFFDNINYPKFVFPASIAVIALTYLHPIFLNYIYSTKEVGLFAIANRFLLLPAIVVGAVVSGLFRAKISQLYFANEYEMIRITYLNMIKFMGGVAVICFPIILMLIINLDNFIQITNWSELGNYSIFLVGYAIAQFWISPLLNIPLVLNQHKKLLLTNLAQLLILFVVYSITWITKISIFDFLKTISTVYIVFSIGLTVYLFNLIKR